MQASMQLNFEYATGELKSPVNTYGICFLETRLWPVRVGRPPLLVVVTNRELYAALKYVRSLTNITTAE